MNRLTLMIAELGVSSIITASVIAVLVSLVDESIYNA